MEIRKQLNKIADEYEALKIENKQLRIDNQGLQLEIERNRKQFEEILDKTKKTYKAQYKRHVTRYENRIQELIRRIKKMGGGKDTGHMIFDTDLPPPGSSGIKPIIPKMNAVSNNKRININSSPTKQDIPSTQYSSDVETELSASPRVKIKENNEQQKKEASVHIEQISDNDGGTSQVSQVSLGEDMHHRRYTALQRRAMINNELINNFMDLPNFKVNLTINPITQQAWNLLDFKRIDRGEDETPPFMWIKDNNSQEDLIKQQAFEKKNQQLINKCFQQCLHGKNKFEFEILNKYVEANRYVVDEINPKI